MSVRMYVYDMGIVDYYNGMMPLIDYIKLCPVNGNFCETNYLSHKQIKEFLLNCFMEVKISSKTGWEGDVRGLDEIAISAIPRPTGMTPWKMLVFKQNNNGESFLVSECKLHIDEDDAKEGMTMAHLTKKDTDYRDLVMYFFGCMDLVEELFDKALSKEEKFHEESNVEKIDNFIDNDKNKNSKFDIDNYEKL